MKALELRSDNLHLPGTKRLRIDKQVIIQALRTEPLTARKFGIRDAKGCSYCAVGAALRQAGMPEPRLKQAHYSTDVYWADDDYEHLGSMVACHNICPGDRAPPGNWLSALSIVWEFLNDDPEDGATPEDLRPDILAWAEDSIPEAYVAYVEVPNPGGVGAPAEGVSA